MSYISHEDYKDLMRRFQKETPKGILKEALDPVGQEDSDIDNDGDTDKTDKYLLKRRQAIGKAIKGDVDEYGYADNYPGSWGYREGEEHPGEAERARIDNIAGRMKDMGMDAESIYDTLVGKYDVDSMVADSVVGQLFGKKEGLNPAPLQATGPTIDVKELFNTPLPGANKDRIEKLVSQDQFGLKNWGPELTYAIAIAEDMLDKGIGEEYIFSHLVDIEGMSTAKAKEAINIAIGDDDRDTKPFPKRGKKATRKSEGLNPAPMQATGQSIEEDRAEAFKLPKRTDTSKLDYDPDASRFEPDYMKAPGEDDDDDDDIEFNLDDDDVISSSDDISKSFKKAIARDKTRYPFLREDQAHYGFKALSPDEVKQLTEYIESVKTIKKEIARLAAKAGKKVKTEGGDMTGLTMTPSVTSEAASHETIERIESKIPEKLYSASEKVIKHLKKSGLTPGEIKMFLNHEVEEMAKKAAEAQYDIAEKKSNLASYSGLKLKTVPNPNAGKYRVISVNKSGGVLDDRFFDTEEEASKAGRDLKVSFKVVKLPDTMNVHTK